MTDHGPTVAALYGYALPATFPVVAYGGMREASASVFLGEQSGRQFFAVASDDSNQIRIYELGAVRGPHSFADLRQFIGHNSSDLEGAARIGALIYWISSHSFTEGRNDRKERRLFFATLIGWTDDGPTLRPVGIPAIDRKGAKGDDIRDAIVRQVPCKAEDLNIEGLASGEDGALLIGLRSPLKDGKALVLPLLNPLGIVMQQDDPVFGAVRQVDLGGRGIRSMERLAVGRYLIIAGPVVDTEAPFQIYLWDGASEVAEMVGSAALRGLKPEASFAVADTGLICLVSDDGDQRQPGEPGDDADPGEPAGREFRTLTIRIE